MTQLRYYFLSQEDDNKPDENGSGGGGEDAIGAPNTDGGEAKESDGLPVVRGVCVDYIHANRDGASVFGRQKWRESGR